MYLEVFYTTYLGLCAALIFWLGRTLHRAGSIFLGDSFGGNTTLVRAVAHLLDIGFYLVSIGYVAVWHQVWWPMNSYGVVAQAVSVRVGGFLLLLGFAHLFNLLLLALFRRRASSANGAATS